jgi:ketosteroid isomerase-like protein
MKRASRSAAGALAVALGACGGAQPMARSETNEARQQVEAVLDDFHAAAAVSDEARYFDHFSADGVFLGTDATERWTVTAFRTYAHPHFAAGKGWTYTPVERHVAFDATGQVAWFDERLSHTKYGQLRGSGVLVVERARWRVAQYNLTFLVPNETASEVVDLIRAPSSQTPAR